MYSREVTTDVAYCSVFFFVPRFSIQRKPKQQYAWEEHSSATLNSTVISAEKVPPERLCTETKSPVYHVYVLYSTVSVFNNTAPPCLRRSLFFLVFILNTPERVKADRWGARGGGGRGGGWYRSERQTDRQNDRDRGRLREIQTAAEREKGRRGGGGGGGGKQTEKDRNRHRETHTETERKVDTPTDKKKPDEEKPLNS